MKEVKEKNPFDEIDKTIKKRGGTREKYEPTRLQQVYDNLDFAKKIEEDPIVTEDFDVKVFGVETVNLDSYINMRVWPRGIYVTDKLIRLVAGSRLEFLKRYIRKKNAMNFDFLWLLILLMIGGIGVILVIMFLLPRLGGLGGIV